MVQLLWNDVARFVESFVTGMLLAVRSSYIANPNATGTSFDTGEVLLPAPIYSAVPPTNGFVSSNPEIFVTDPAAWTQSPSDHSNAADSGDSSHSTAVVIGHDTSHDVSDSSLGISSATDHQQHGLSTTPTINGSNNATDVVTLQDLQTVLMLLQNVLNRQASTISNIMSMVNQTDTHQADTQTSGSDQTWTLPVIGGPPASAPSSQLHSPSPGDPHLDTGIVAGSNSFTSTSAPQGIPTSWWWQGPASPTLNTKPNNTPISTAAGSTNVHTPSNGFPAFGVSSNNADRGSSFQSTSGTIFHPNGQVAAFPSLGGSTSTSGSTYTNSGSSSNLMGSSGASSFDSAHDTETNSVPFPQPGSCGIPVAPAGVQLRLQEFMGGWYEYEYRTPGFSPAFNVYNNYSALGYTFRRDTSSWVLAATSNVFMYLESAQSNGQPQCVGMFEETNFTSDGQKIALSFYQNNPPVNFTYTILSTDYSNMCLLYRCNRPNTTSQFCDDPFFWVNTRVDPRTLSAASRTYIQSLVDNALQPYCYSSRDMVLTNWTNAPACSPPAPPLFTSFVQNLQSTLAQPPTNTRDFRRT